MEDAKALVIYWCLTQYNTVKMHQKLFAVIEQDCLSS
jgi:hypothetical protein